MLWYIALQEGQFPFKKDIFSHHYKSQAGHATERLFSVFFFDKGFCSKCSHATFLLQKNFSRVQPPSFP